MTTAPSSIPHSDPDSGPGEDASLAERQRHAIARLVRLAREQTSIRAQIDETRDTALTDAESAHARAHESAQRTAEEARAQNEHKRDARLKEAKALFKAKSAEALRAHNNARDDAIERLDSELHMAEEKLRDAAWLAEATFEGSGEQPKVELERVRGIVRDEFGKLESIEAHARRLAGPRIDFPNPTPDENAPPTTSSHDPADDLDTLASERHAANEMLKKLRGITLHAFVRSGGPIVMILLGAAGGAAYHIVEHQISNLPMTAAYTLGGGAAMLVFAWPIRMLALAGTRKRVTPLAAHLRAARAAGIAAIRTAEAHKQRIEKEITDRKQTEVDAGRSRYQNRLAVVKQRREQTLTRLDRKHVIIAAEIKKKREKKLDEINTRADTKEAEIAETLASALATADQTRDRAVADARRAHSDAVTNLDRALADASAHADACTEASLAAMSSICPPWSSDIWPAGPTRVGPAPGIRVGTFSLALPTPGGGSESENGNAETRELLRPPAMLDTPAAASLVVRTGAGETAEGRESALQTLRNATLRALTALPPGKVRLTMLDPVGLGQSFAGFMRLADHDERLVDSKIWTEARHIEQRLAGLTEHMETVIQKYLRNEFASIDAYNEKAGEIAEPYRFLVVADFPTGFTEESARRLASIIESGPRCGVFVLLHHDARAKLPENITADILDEGCSVVEFDPEAPGQARFVWRDEAYETLPLSLESPPSDTEKAKIIDALGKAALEFGKVEVPFSTLAPGSEREMWSETCSDELRIPLGRSGATRLQKLAFGKGTSQHALIAGKTGSGKSTLLHVMITAGALWYSPDELEFYLVDFKKGVEFKAYTGGRLPHARAVAIESDREFGLSVLQRLDDELVRRGDLFRDLGVQSIGAAREALKASGKNEALPRTMLVIDEFQEIFTEDDKIAQDAGLLLDRLVRQGRAFGMHVFLGSQTLSGAYSLARSTMGQMAVRIALQCSETDSYLILSEDNAAARLLNRPGEAIYNDANGMVEGNNPFQVCWLPDAERDAMLERVRTKMHDAPPVSDTHTIVFEGNIPADLADNQELLSAIAPDAAPVRAAKAWVGDPVAIKPPTGAHLRRQAGANLIVVGQQEETARAMLSASMVGLAAQHAADPTKGPGGVKIAFLDPTPPDDPEADSVENIVARLAEPGALDVRFGRVRALADTLAAFDAERARRESDESAAHTPWYLFFLGLQRFRDLRQKDDDFSFSFSGDDDTDGAPSPSAQLGDLLRDGPALGLHVIAWCDTATSMGRVLDRRAQGHFEQRAILQMSAADSANLIDSPAAGKLGMNRGLLFNEELGTLEKFRPYHVPSDDLVRRVAAALRR